jgi:hypothetical protein
VKIYKAKSFARFAKSEDIADSDLREAVENAEAGSIDADLGSGVIKQRIARKGEGKSGGFRTVILYRQGDKAFFVHGFAKNDRENISPTELKAFRKLAKVMLAFDEKMIAAILKNKTFIEVVQP